MKEDIQYKHFSATHNLKAPSIVVPILYEIFSPSSVVDVGCGIGNWLKVFQDIGVTDVLGLDGYNVNKKELLIDDRFFKQIDLRKEINLDRKFDLVLCLEVAEHLSEDLSDSFVDLLVSLGSAVVFSAALPGQGGQNHLNEQWLTYWVAKFEKRGFKYFDIVRPLIWNNEEVDFWYKQNMVTFSKKEMNQNVQPYISIVHPDLLQIKNAELFSLYQKARRPDIGASLRLLARAIYSSLKK